MTNGQRFSQSDPTTAAFMRSSLGSQVIITHNGRTIPVIVKDTGAFDPAPREITPKGTGKGIIDLSKAAFKKLADLAQGRISVCVRYPDNI